MPDYTYDSEGSLPDLPGGRWVIREMALAQDWGSTTYSAEISFDMVNFSGARFSAQRTPPAVQKYILSSFLESFDPLIVQDCIQEWLARS